MKRMARGGMPTTPHTVIEKVGYSQYSLASDLAYIGKALNRLGTVYNLLGAAENSGSELPAIILNNELRMALEPLMRVQADINEIVDWLLPIYNETKPEDKPVEMREGERSCENCGNTHCANSFVAYNWDACVDSNFTKHWMPKKGGRA